MSYFLSIDDINKVEENVLDESNIKLMAQYDITDNELENLDLPNVSVENNCILCRNENILIKLSNSGNLSKLPTEEGFVASKFTESIEENNKSWRNRVNFRTVDNVGTFLSVRNDIDCGNMKFENGEEIEFKHEFSELIEVECNGRYLSIIVSGIADIRRCQVFPYCLVVIEIIRKNDKENVLMEVFRTYLQDMFPNFDFRKIIFNKNLSSKMLLILQDEKSHNLALVTFDTTSFNFSAAFDLEDELSSDLFSEEVDIEGGELKDDIYYYFHNVLKDVVLIVADEIVYIIKQQINSDSLYIYKQCVLPVPSILYGSKLCNNRNNELLLFYPANILEGEEDHLEINVGIIVYDILNDILILPKNFCYSNGKINTILCNDTGEEIFIVDGKKLNIFVYKSKVKSLKKTCQILVLERYTSEQLDQMNLPKYILTSE